MPQWTLPPGVTGHQPPVGFDPKNPNMGTCAGVLFPGCKRAIHLSMWRSQPMVRTFKVSRGHCEICLANGKPAHLAVLLKCCESGLVEYDAKEIATIPDLQVRNAIIVALVLSRPASGLALEKPRPPKIVKMFGPTPVDPHNVEGVASVNAKRDEYMRKLFGF